jgi:serine/threonine protein phosphatase 1
VIWNLGHQSRPSSIAQVPDDLRIYAIGDIHGRADLLASLFARIDASRGKFPAERAVHVYLGDYVDRGPSSQDVLHLLISRGLQFPSAFLKGNHESYLISFLEDPTVFSEWRQYGGLDTLLSYGLTPSLFPDKHECAALSLELKSVMPELQRRFLQSLKLSFTCGGYFFVHAGVRPGVPLERQREEDLLWIRDDFLLHEDGYEKFIVHGHTPVIEPDIRSNRINIDTGAYATGRLTCLVLERDQMAFL